MATIDFTDKVKQLNETRTANLISKLPLTYVIKINRKKPVLDNKKELYDEDFTWGVSPEMGDHPYGPVVIFNHLISIIDHMAHEKPKYMELLKNYVTDELGMGDSDDSNFNK